MKYLKKLYDWVLSLAHTPHGAFALFAIAFMESSFFPIPPDVLLIALVISAPSKFFYFALICTLGSVIGGAFGYMLGMLFMDTIGINVIKFFGYEEKLNYIKDVFNEYDAWVIAVAGFTPVPYKIFTITAGAFKTDFMVFMIASTLSRGARFFLVSLLLYKFGAQIKDFIDKYFNIITIVFTLILIGGFILLKFLK